MLNFYRGLRSNYPAEVVAGHELWDAIYFATDTFEIIINGECYGLEQRNVIDVNWDETNDKIIIFRKQYFDAESSTYKFQDISFNAGLSEDDAKAIDALRKLMTDGELDIVPKYVPRIENDALSMLNPVGGIPAGTTVATFKNKEKYPDLNAVLDDLFFPTIAPTQSGGSVPAITFSATSPVEIGSVGLTAASFTKGYSKGTLKYNGLTITASGGEITSDKITLGSTEVTTTPVPATMPEGGTTYIRTVTYADYDIPKDNKGNNVLSALYKSKTLTKEITITAVYPWFATSTAGNELTKVALNTSKSNVPSTGLKLVPFDTAGNTYQAILLPGKLSSIQILNTMNNSWATGDKTKWTEDGPLTIALVKAKGFTFTNNKEPLDTAHTYYLYTYNAIASGGEQSIKVTYA